MFSTEALRELAENSCVRVSAYRTVTMASFTRPDLTERQREGTGTGFFVQSKSDQPNYYSILTCCHVVEGTHPTQVSIIFPKFGKVPFKTAHIQSVCPAHDLAIIGIRIDDPEIRRCIRPLELQARLPVGAPVAAFGYPLGQWGLTGTEGTYGSFQDGKYQHNADISPGNSGGPLIDKSTGKCVGVNASTIVGGAASGVHYAVPIALYERLSEDMLSGSMKTVSPPRLGICYHVATEALLEKTFLRRRGIAGGAQTREGTYIHHVFKGSAADMAGLKPGAIISTIQWETGPGESYTAEYSIDRFGECLTAWNGKQKVALEYVLERIPTQSTIKIKYIELDDGKEKVCEFRQRPITGGAFRHVSAPLEPFPDFVFFAGVCVMPLRANHSAILHDLFVSLPPEQRELENLVVVNVIGSYGDIPLTEGSIIQYVNGVGAKEHSKPSEERMDTVDKFRRAVLNNDGDGFLTIEDTNRRKYVVDLVKTLKKETTPGFKVYTPDKSLLDALSNIKPKTD